MPMVSFAASLLPLLVSAAARERTEHDETRWGFYLLHHDHEWVKSRPELPTIPEIEGICERPVSLTLEPAEVVCPLTGEKVMTRAFNGMTPGPTWRVRPGCKIDLTLYNELKAPSWNTSVTGAQPHLPPIINGSYGYLNTTNIHTHGLHVSPIPPSDSIFMRLEPKNSMRWVYELPANHMGGTHWYHPHLHHATAAQAGGGAAGMIIVEDPKGSVPEYVEKMEERLLIFLVLDFELQASIEKQGMGTYFWQTQSKTVAITVNGVHQPKVTVSQGKWYRFRMLFSAVEMWLQMTNKGSAWCTTKLLAKDGVWLEVAPRPLTGWDLNKDPTSIQLGPANRADIAISCTCPFPKRGCYSEFYSLANCTVENISVKVSEAKVEQWVTGDESVPPNFTPCDPFKNRRRRACEGRPETPLVEAWGPLRPPTCGFGGPAFTSKEGVSKPGLGSDVEDVFSGMHDQNLHHSLLDGFNGTLFSIVVEPTRKHRCFWHPAWRFSVRRPCYLVDMRKAAIEPANQFHIEFWGAGFGEGRFTEKAGPIAIMFDFLSSEYVPDASVTPPIGDLKFVNPPVPPAYGPVLPMGQAIEWYVGGLAYHPFHLHVTPFQLVNFSSLPDAWLQEGDWHDSLLTTTDISCPEGGGLCLMEDTKGGGYGANPGNATVRFWTDQFPGQYVSHCHILTHEDEGMMFWMNVSGSPGQVPSQAQLLDPTCYTGRLEGWGYRWRLKQQGSDLMQQQQQQQQQRLGVLVQGRWHTAYADKKVFGAMLRLGGYVLCMLIGFVILAWARYPCIAIMTAIGLRKTALPRVVAAVRRAD